MHTIRQKYGDKFLYNTAHKCNLIFDAPCTLRGVSLARVCSQRSAAVLMPDEERAGFARSPDVWVKLGARFAAAVQRPNYRQSLGLVLRPPKLVNGRYTDQRTQPNQVNGTGSFEAVLEHQRRPQMGPQEKGSREATLLELRCCGRTLSGT